MKGIEGVFHPSCPKFQMCVTLLQWFFINFRYQIFNFNICRIAGPRKCTLPLMNAWFLRCLYLDTLLYASMRSKTSGKTGRKTSRSSIDNHSWKKTSIVSTLNVHYIFTVLFSASWHWSLDIFLNLIYYKKQLTLKKKIENASGFPSERKHRKFSPSHGVYLERIARKRGF